MSRFVIMAEDAIKNHNNENIDEYLNKIASSNGLNNNEHQRLIEEYNIGSFLSKLQDGSQHEEYQVASPVQSAANSESFSGSSLGKTAADNTKYIVHEDMFHLSVDDDFSDSSLEKVASTSIGDELFTSEEKWSKANDTLSSMLQEDENALEKVAKNNAIIQMASDLLKVSSYSEGMTKTAILSLHNIGLDTEAESMLENSKFSTSDIASAKTEPLSSDGITILSKIAAANG